MLVVLRESQERLRAVLDNALIGFYQAAPDGQVLMANPAVLRMLSVESAEQLSRLDPVGGVMSDGAWRPDFTARLARDGTVIGLETAWRRSDGTVVFLRENARVVRDTHGRPILYEGTLEDVTERRRTEEALRTSEARYRDLFENASDLIQSVSHDAHFRYVNPAWRRALGYSLTEVADLTLWSVVREDHHEQCREMLARLFAGEQLAPFETVFVAKDGRSVFLEGSVSCRLDAGQPTATRGIFRDITARREAEALIRLQAAALEAVANAIVITDRTGAILWVNPAFTTMTGYSAEDARGRSPRLLKSGHHDNEYYGTMWQTILSGRPWRGHMVNRRKDGERYHEQSLITPLLDEERRVTHFVAIKEDITERVRAQKIVADHERQLARFESRFRTLLEHAPEAIVVTDEVDAIVMVNAACEALLGYRREEMVGRPFGTLVPSGREGQSAIGSVGPVSQTPPAGRGQERRRGYVRSENGEEVPVEFSVSRESADADAWTMRYLVDLRQSGPPAMAEAAAAPRCSSGASREEAASPIAASGEGRED